MSDEIRSALAESLPADVNAVSSPAPKQEEPVAPAVAPAQKAEPSEPPFNQHPDWIAFKARQERQVDEERQRNQLLAQQNNQLMELVNRIQPQQDPNQTPEEKAFWDKQRQVAREEAQKVADENVKRIMPQLDESRATTAALLYARFQEKHPDVVQNSPEENAIALKIRQGYDMEDAYKLVMHEKIIQREVGKVKASQTQKTQEKIAANMETTSIPQTSGVKTKENISFRDALRKNMAT